MTLRHPSVLFQNVEIDGRGVADCRVQGGLVQEIGNALDPGGVDHLVEGRGGALIPGLADHHLHLAATAAHERSLDLTNRTSLTEAFVGLDPDVQGWSRAVGYDEETHGPLDRQRLDELVGEAPVRVQHRSGALWVLNTAALDRLGVSGADHPGIERDARGAPTGRLWRADHWLSDALAALPGERPPVSLGSLGARLASYGVTHVTDATPGSGHVALVVDAVASGAVPQHVLLLADKIPEREHPRVRTGPVKLVVADHELPGLDELARRVADAHDAGRPVAVHCVTAASLALTLAALDVAGSLPGDRLEHAAVADPALATAIAERGLAVVTQPSLVARRGDDYWERSDPAEQGFLWPYRSLVEAGVRVAASSDAPYGDLDPWATLSAAAARRTGSSRVVGAHERVPAEVALRGMLSRLDDPGGDPRRVATGEPADLVLLDRPIRSALADTTHRCVRLTLVEGRIVHDAEASTR